MHASQGTGSDFESWPSNPSNLRRNFSDEPNLDRAFSYRESNPSNIVQISSFHPTSIGGRFYGSIIYRRDFNYFACAREAVTVASSP
jgi:hypothetical protein